MSNYVLRKANDKSFEILIGKTLVGSITKNANGSWNGAFIIGHGGSATATNYGSANSAFQSLQNQAQEYGLKKLYGSERWGGYTIFTNEGLANENIERALFNRQLVVLQQKIKEVTGNRVPIKQFA